MSVPVYVNSKDNVVSAVGQDFNLNMCKISEILFKLAMHTARPRSNQVRLLVFLVDLIGKSIHPYR